MSFTCQQVCDLARTTLNDAGKKRYTDALLQGFLNSAVLRAYDLRPDLLFGSGWTGSSASLALGTTFPLPDRYAQTTADYVSGRAEMRDDDSVNSGRAAQLMKLYEAELSS